MRRHPFLAGANHVVFKLAFVLNLLGVVNVLLAAPEAPGAAPGSSALNSAAAQPLVSVPGRFQTSSSSNVVAEEVPPLGPQAGPTGYQWTFSQPALLAPTVDELKRAGAKEGRLQIGLGRIFDPPLVVNGSTAPAGDWTVLPNGWRIWSVDVSSAGALGVRLHLTSLALPADVRLVVYDPANPSAPSAPITARTLHGQRDYWSATLFSERVVVECQVPPGVDTKSISFSIAGLSHIFQIPLLPAAPYKEGTCHNDVSCYPNYATEASGVARIEFVDSGNTYLCTGCLLADNSPGQSTDFFLTANHCIGNQTVASTAEFWWMYQTHTCNGTVPSPSSVPHTTGGADFLAGGTQSDFAFLRLRRNAPANAFHLGWTLSLPSSSQNLACIHHPGGAYKRISFGNQTGTDGDFWAVVWSSGVTEPGSSGGPLLDASHLVIGQLTGGQSSCSNPSGIDTFGRFDVTFRSIQAFLGGASNSNQSMFVKGTYTGLFSDPTNGVSPAGAGGITINTTAKGKFSGKLQIAATRYSMSGQFDSAGSAQVNVSSRNSSPLTIQLQIDPTDSDHIAGSVAGNTWTALLDMDRAVYGSKSGFAPDMGLYTVVMPGNPGASGSPGGASFGAVNVSKAGSLKFSGTLADGTKVSQGSAVSKYGQWPLYAPLYRGQGMVFSWVNFTNSDTADLAGTVYWYKPLTPGSKAYTLGFTNSARLFGSSYIRPPKGTTILSFDNAMVNFLGGPLDQDFSNPIGLDSNSRVSNQGSNRMTLRFSTGNGLFNGKVQDPNSGQTYSFNGAVLQKPNNGSGFFLGSGLSGEVLLGQ